MSLIPAGGDAFSRYLGVGSRVFFLPLVLARTFCMDRIINSGLSVAAARRRRRLWNFASSCRLDKNLRCLLIQFVCEYMFGGVVRWFLGGKYFC